MNEQDFNRIKEISKEINDIRLRNNLIELHLRAKDSTEIFSEEHKGWDEWNEVMLFTRNKEVYRSYKKVSMVQDKATNEMIDMEYDEYMNYTPDFGFN